MLHPFKSLRQLLFELDIPIKEKFDLKNPIGYYKSTINELPPNVHINRLNDKEIILSQTPIRLGKSKYTIKNNEYILQYHSHQDCQIIEKSYQHLKTLVAVPEMKFPELGTIIQEHKPGKTLLEAKTEEIHKSQLIEFIKDINKLGYCHRDLHAKNIIISKKALFVIDWDFVTEQKCKLKECYDLTGKGVESPHLTRNTNIFKEFPFIGMPSVAKLLKITWNDLK